MRTSTREIRRPHGSRPAALLASVFLIAGLFPATALAGGDPPALGPTRPLAPHAPGILLVGFSPAATAAERASARSAAGALSAAPLGGLARGVERWTLPAGKDLATAIGALARNPRIRYAEPDYLLRSLDTSNDPYYVSGSLWGMHGDGIAPYANQYGTGADEAWAAGYTGSRDVYIGVIDEGIQYTHPDLTTNIWTNPDEIAGNGIDDDRNGYVDDVHGYDFYYGDGTVFDGSAGSTSVDAHGTHVSGTIGGIGANGQGVAGMNWRVGIISGKFLGPGGGYTSGATLAADYLTMLKRTKGLNIVATSNSWGGGGFSQTLLDAIDRGGDAGILFVAAAGNSASNNDGTANYPSNYQCTTTATGAARGWDCVVAVAAIDSGGGLASFSSYGATTVDLGAPGVGVVSSVPMDSYASYSGTSMATPHVSGAVALCASINPALTAPQIRSAIVGTTAATASLAGRTVSGGRLDAGALPGACLPAVAPPSGAPSGLSATARDLSSIRLSWADGVTGESAWEIQRATGTAGSCGAFATIATAGVDATAFTAAGLTPSTSYCFRVRATNTYAGGSATAWSDEASATTFAPPPAILCSPIASDWVDPAGGTTLALSDDSSSEIALPFTFSSYGTSYARVSVSSNGFLRLGGGTATAYSNTSIPGLSEPNAFIAPAWDDWNPSAGGTVSYRTVGSAPSRRFVVTWTAVPHYNVAGSAVTFQAVLEEGGDAFRLQYLDMVTGSTSYDAGLSATAGVEGSTGEWGTTVSYGQARLTDGSAWRCSAVAGIAPTIGALTWPDATTGVPYRATLTASGGVAPYAWTVSGGALPAGLALDRSSGVVSGTPTVAGTASFTVSAVGSDGGSTSAGGSIRVADPLTVTTASLPIGSVGVAYSASLASNGGRSPIAWSLAPGSSLPAGLVLASNGAISGTPSTDGTTSVTLVATDAATPVARVASATLSIGIVLPLVVSGPTTYPDGTTGVRYGVALSASAAADLGWSLAGGTLPPGLAVDPATGAIAGTPTTAGTYDFTVKAESATAGAGTTTGRIVVAAPIAVATGSLAGATAGSSYTATLTASGGTGPFSWTLASGSLPAGLTLDPATGAIAGTPTVSGSFALTVRVTDAAQPVRRTASRALTLTVPFAKRSPAANVKLARTTSTTVSWYEYVGATGYELCVTTSTKGCGTSGWSAVSAASTSSSVTVSAGQTYYWQVRALGATTVTANNGSYWKFSISR